MWEKRYMLVETTIKKISSYNITLLETVFHNDTLKLSCSGVIVRFSA